MGAGRRRSARRVDVDAGAARVRRPSHRSRSAPRWPRAGPRPARGRDRSARRRCTRGSRAGARRSALGVRVGVGVKPGLVESGLRGRRPTDSACAASMRSRNCAGRSTPVSEKLMAVRKSPPSARLMLVASAVCTLVWMRWSTAALSAPCPAATAVVSCSGVELCTSAQDACSSAQSAVPICWRSVSSSTGLMITSRNAPKPSSPSHTASRSSMPGAWNVRVP